MFRVSRVLSAAALSLAIPAAVFAQMGGQPAAPDGFRLTYESAKSNLTKSAEQVTEANYGFKPTPEVRSIGQLFGHVANANFMICAMASGLPNPSKADFEKSTAKAELQKALADSFAFCDKAWGAVTAANAGEAVDIFGMKHTRASGLSFNTAHIWEHYGNLVTYMRLKGMVPPSSQGR